MAASSSSFTRGRSLGSSWFDNLPPDWSWHRLDDLCLAIVDCPHSTPDVVEDGPYLMARTSDILTGVFRARDAQRVSEPTYRARVRRDEPRHGDLLYSREGTYFGLSAEVPPDTTVCLGQRMVLLRPDPIRLNPTYLRYWLNSSHIQAYIHGYRDGSVAERLNLPTIRTIPMLGALDEKIELNRRMSETLEAMARALFKSWFVDFDPVRAKAEDRAIGLPRRLAGLFPGSFEDSELGRIPAGWSVTPIGGLAHVVGGATPSTQEARFWDGGHHHWATPKDLSDLSTPVLLSTDRKITDAGLGEIGSGLLSAGTVLLSSRAPIGYLAICEIPVAINQGFIAILPKEGVPNLFLLYWAEWAHEEILSRANGSTFLEISKASFRPIPAIAPPRPVLGAFDELVRSLYSRIVANERESRLLGNLRDSLLPKLVSGELRVPDAERFVAAAT